MTSFHRKERGQKKHDQIGSRHHPVFGPKNITKHQKRKLIAPKSNFVADRLVDPQWPDEKKFTDAAIQDLPNYLWVWRQARGFNTRVRDYFLSILPSAQMPSGQVDLFLCPWCNESYTKAATHVDHIIPKAIYLRYRLFKDRTKENIRLHYTSLLTKYLHDKKNLLIACATCNTQKGNKLITYEDLKELEENAKNVGNQYWIQDKIQEARSVLNDYSGLGNKESNEYLTVGFNAAIPDSTYFQNREDMWGGETAIRGKSLHFEASRVRTDLNDKQRMQTVTNYNAKLCFYCLGFYHPGAFQIDHIKPTRNQDLSFITYNRPGNLFAVCAECNCVKKDNPLSLDFLLQQIKNRSTQGIPGAEHTQWCLGNSEKEKIKHAFAIQVQVFRNKLKAGEFESITQDTFDHWMQKN